MRTFNVCRNPNCNQFRSFPLHWKKCSDCFQALTIEKHKDERNWFVKLMMESSLFLYITFPLGSFILSYILSLNYMASNKHLYFVPLIVFLMQLSGMYRLYPMLVKEDYEFNIDPDGGKFFSIHFLALVMSGLITMVSSAT